MNKSLINEKVEILALTIQKYLSDNPSILIGSGCSVPYGLPTMDDLAKEIVEKLDRVVIYLKIRGENLKASW